MIEIDKNFVGGNICVSKIDGDVVELDRELRDSTSDWFFWAFRVRGAQGRTITFRFTHRSRLGYWGAAVSNDLKTWSWTGERIEDEEKGTETFVYTFGEQETETYFAHNMLYSPARFEKFAKEHGLTIQEFCKSNKGRSVPFVTFGNGDKTILLTARHHACENTGNYVLEGVLESFIQNPIAGYKFICVPFVDYDGVVDGDQGKNRAPHDHNRDYAFDEPSLYNTCAKLREIADAGVHYSFDFHSPWHIGGENDKVYMVYTSEKMTPKLKLFGKTFTECITKDAMWYNTENDHRANVYWHDENAPTFGRYVARHPENELAFSLETPYFGEDGNAVSQPRMLALGECFAKAVRQYITTVKMSFVGDILCYPDMTENTDKHYEIIFAKVKKYLQDCDYLVGNLETPVAGEDLLFTHERFCFNTPDEYLDALKDAGFHLLSLANNHCMDRGEEGILRTLDACQNRGFDTVGLYRSQKERDTLFVKHLGGVNVAFINYTYGTNAFAHHRFLTQGHEYMVNLFQPQETLPGSIHLLLSPEEIERRVQEIYVEKGEEYAIVKPFLDALKADIEKAKQQADYVVMLSHCGGQRNAYPEAYTKWLMQKIKSWGADVIVGLHPHVIQPCEVKDGYLTVYDLGNFICPESSFGTDTHLDQSLSTLLNLYLQKDANGKLRLKAGFRILKIVTEKGVPVVHNLFELYQQTKDENLKALSIEYANFFAGKNLYTDIRDEYFLYL